MHVIIEKFVPLIIAVAITTSLIYFELSFADALNRVSSDIINISAVLTGFLLSLYSIYRSISSNRINFLISSEGLRKRFERYLAIPIFSNFIVMISVLAWKVELNLPKEVSVAVFFFAILTYLQTFRFLFFFYFVLKK